MEYGTTKMFGKPFQQIDFWKEKPQGKAAYELADLLKDNEVIRQIVENPKMRFKVNNYLTKKDIVEKSGGFLQQLMGQIQFRPEPDPTGLLQHLWP